MKSPISRARCLSLPFAITEIRRKYRGLATTSPIRAGDVILSAPLSIAISSDAALRRFGHLWTQVVGTVSIFTAVGHAVKPLHNQCKKFCAVKEAGHDSHELGDRLGSGRWFTAWPASSSTASTRTPPPPLTAAAAARGRGACRPRRRWLGRR